MKTVILIVAHGTVDALSELPEFLREIRRGRPAPDGLLEELLHRYQAVGGSPLLAQTQEQAAALSAELSLETRVAMRLWNPRVKDVLKDLTPEDRVVLVPAAPFSVPVYAQAARRELSAMDAPPQLVCVEAWGQRPELIDAYVEQLRPHVHEGSATLILLTAHSLPMQVIRAGDMYGAQFEATVSLVEQKLGHKVSYCYQSQGAVEGDWLGPDLVTTLKQAAADGMKRVVLSPAGFLTEHVETLYDLDVECRALTDSLGLEFHRIPALRTHPLLIKALSGAVSDVLLQA